MTLLAVPISPLLRMPTIVVPSRQQPIRLSGTCPHCRGSMFNIEWPSVDIDRPHPNYRGTVLCLLCARECAYLVLGEVRVLPTADELRTLTVEPSRPGRPQKGVTYLSAPDPAEQQRKRQAAYYQRVKDGLVVRKRWARDFDACVNCGTTERRHAAHGRCCLCRDRSAEHARRKAQP